MPAIITDPSLKNSWGISRSATSPWWVSNQGTNTATLYSVTGSSVTKNALTVTIPTTGGPPQGPTGQVRNNGSSFLVNGSPASFIFANLNGTISAWNQSAGTTAVVEAASTGGVYTGLAINIAQSQLYAANNAGGSIDVFSNTFAPVNLGPNAFKDPAVGALVPFNAQDINGNVYVT